MDNKTMARLLAETADLMEIDGADSFRVRSYRRAADAAEQTTVDLVEAANDAARLMEIDGIGKSMAAKLQAIVATGTLPQRDELLAKYGVGILELLKLPGMGPKTVTLLWDAAQIGTVDQLAGAIDAGRLKGLPRMGDKQIEKLRKGIEDYRRSVGRFRIDVAEEEAERIVAYLKKFKGIDKVTPAGSLRRGRETIGDLDLLATGPACAPEKTGAAVEYIAAYPGIHDIIVKGENKVSFHVAQGMQVDVRLLPSASYGAALQYFTGSKAHNVVLRQRALKMGYTLNEWALARLDDESIVAAATEEEIYSALKMDWMPPEMRENLGEIDAAADHKLPRVVALSDIRGDVHMHTAASDGRNSIGEMAEAAIACGYQYIAITDHSKFIGITNGLDEKRVLEQIKQVREVDSAIKGRIRIFTGIEVDILADGALALADEVLAQMDVVIASIHSRFDQSREEMTQRVMRAIENPNVRILGHPTGRLLLRREPFALDMGAILRRAAELGVAMEHNAAPERLDLNDHDLRLAKELGCKIVMSSDSHDSRNLGKMGYGARQLRRAWLTPEDVLNTRDAKGFLAGLRPRA
ncbi:PHP domain protein [Candidatus Sulfotelmatomonas gaucii]|uniref:DNA polymerase beta n=1 Tax=Candidatus Sulfuritelmatomonas gaucii TaxID=2043161 RepID=A0A2N9L2H7_9BACT|nr:PHP domain protein [Candidatus Sulfotelmatomonas gaucii]